MNQSSEDNDDGLSLVELIFYVLILGLISTGIAVLFFNTWRTQATVTDQVDATERGQVIASQIEKAMRNAVAFKVTDSTLAPDLNTGSTLIVATAMSGANACMAFDFSGGDAKLTTTSGAQVSTSPAWPKWQSGIVQHDLEPFFDGTNDDFVIYSFDVTSPDGPDVHFEGTSYRRNQSGSLPGGTAHTCF